MYSVANAIEGGVQRDPAHTGHVSNNAIYIRVFLHRTFSVDFTSPPQRWFLKKCNNIERVAKIRIKIMFCFIFYHKFIYIPSLAISVLTIS